MEYQIPVTMIRGLKGAPLSVLVVLALIRTPVGQEYLERMTGYTDKTVDSALMLLLDYGLVTRNGRYQWQISLQGQQLPIPVDGALEGGEPESSTEEPSESGSRNYSESENFRVPLPSSSSLTTKIEILEIPTTTKPPESEKFRVLQELDRWGIREPKRTELAAMPHVTPELVRYHCATAANTGLAIYRISKNWAIKALPKSDQPLQVPEIPAAADGDPVPDELLEVFDQAKTRLRDAHRPVDWETWIHPCHLAGADAETNTWHIRAANPFAAAWIKENTLGDLVHELETITGQPACVEVGV